LPKPNLSQIKNKFDFTFQKQKIKIKFSIRQKKSYFIILMGGSNSRKALTPTLETRVKDIFWQIDTDKSGTIDKEETMKYWKANFAKLNTEELFKAVDADGNGTIELEEWVDFWRCVKGSGHTEADIAEELEMLADGEAWVKFDNVDVSKK
jgi:Ca2+-binding EF-hand superfamily protein